MESWPTSSIESWESALFYRRYGVLGAFLNSCVEIGVPIDLTRVSQGISGVAQRKSSHLSCIRGTGDCSEANAGELVIIWS